MLPVTDGVESNELWEEVQIPVPWGFVAGNNFDTVFSFVTFLIKKTLRRTVNELAFPLKCSAKVNISQLFRYISNVVTSFFFTVHTSVYVVVIVARILV